MTPVAGGPIPIGPGQLALALVFVLAAGAVSMAMSLGLHRNLLLGTVRTFAQLFLMGYALKFIFGLDMALPVVGVVALVVAASTHIVRGRVKERDVAFGVPVFLTMAAVYLVVSSVVTGLVVGARPWWEPQYFLTIGGMVAGNSMTAIAIALDRLFSSLRRRRDEIEMKLCMGADYKEASAEIMREAVGAGMIPAVNSMMGVGLVSIPGMMTGQIIAGADPALASRYQIVVMLMLAAATALSCFVVVSVVRRMCFGPEYQLLLRKDRD